jgi:hypothetical protein
VAEGARGFESEFQQLGSAGSGYRRTDSKGECGLDF